MSASRVAVESLYDEEITALLALRPVLLLPIGAVESHADHLPAGLSDEDTQNIMGGNLARIMRVDVPVGAS